MKSPRKKEEKRQTTDWALGSQTTCGENVPSTKDRRCRGKTERNSQETSHLFQKGKLSIMMSEERWVRLIH